MKYLCKKSYNKDFIVNKYYDAIDVSGSICFINNSYFSTIEKHLDPYIFNYFYTDIEARKIKLNRLYEISM